MAVELAAMGPVLAAGKRLACELVDTVARRDAKLIIGHMPW